MNVRTHLQAIRDKHGYLNAQLVVDEARDPNHPLHAQFEWDDALAGEKWRLEQAGQLLRVTYRPDPKQPVELRAFVAVKGDETPRAEYMPLDEALADPFTAQLVLRQMEHDWKSFKRRWQNHAHFAEMIRRDIAGGAA